MTVRPIRAWRRPESEVHCDYAGWSVTDANGHRPHDARGVLVDRRAGRRIRHRAGPRCPGEEEPPGWTRGAPDVAAEILSPSDTSTAIHAKTLDYLEAGTGLVWIVDPAARTVTVYRPDGSARLLREHETLEGEGVLDGFSLTLAEVFRDA